MGIVRVWRADLSTACPDWEGRIGELSIEEQAKARRYKMSELQRRFVSSRWLLRNLVAFYTKTDPARPVWTYSEHGKPSQVDSTLQFNLSHTADTWLGAFAWGHELGVDVERVRPMPNAEQLVSRFFSAREQLEFHATPAEERIDALFRGWTRKEAFIKAVGRGLSFPLDQFSVPLHATSSHRIEDVVDPVQAARNWHLTDLPMPTGVYAALVCEGVPERVEVLDWNAEASARIARWE